MKEAVRNMEQDRYKDRQAGRQYQIAGGERGGGGGSFGVESAQLFEDILISVTNCGFGPLSLLCHPQKLTVQCIIVESTHLIVYAVFAQRCETDRSLSAMNCWCGHVDLTRGRIAVS